jgi:hypothetical protein
MNATVYTENGEVLTEGLPPSKTCDLALQCAREFARDFDARVIVEDPTVEGGAYGVEPDGEITLLAGAFWGS